MLLLSREHRVGREAQLVQQMQEPEIVNHFRSVQNKLLQEFEVARTARHPTIRGNAREVFIRNFLNDHLPAKMRIGSGEIVDSKGSRSGQTDIILYRDDIPKLSVVSGIDIFFIEGVIATIEVKSDLDSAELAKALASILKIKSLQRSNIVGQILFGQPVALTSYVFAYDGAQLDTLRSQLRGRLEDQPDMICVLKKGIIVKNDGRLFQQSEPQTDLVTVIMQKDTTLSFFYHLLNSTAGYSFPIYNFTGYVEGHPLE